MPLVLSGSEVVLLGLPSVVVPPVELLTLLGLGAGSFGSQLPMPGCIRKATPSGQVGLLNGWC